MSKMTLSLKSCDRVCDRLHLGDKNAACDLDLLARLKVKLKSVRNFLVPSAPQGKVNFRVQHIAQKLSYSRGNTAVTVGPRQTTPSRSLGDREC